MAISDLLSSLVIWKNKLVENLVEKGVEADENEKLNTLVPKVLDIKSGGAVTEYVLPGETNDEYHDYRIRVDISSIPDYQNLIVGQNLFVMIYNISQYKTSSSDSVIKFSYDIESSYLYISTYYASDSSTKYTYLFSSGGYKKDEWTKQAYRYQIGLYVIS